MEEQIYMTPKQPFFVTASETYKKYIVNRFGIVHFYQCFTGSSPRFAIPDGCVDMVFQCGGSSPKAEICGTVLAPESVLLSSDTCYFGVRFLPGYNPVLGFNSGIMHELVNNRVPLESLIRDDKMLENICKTTDFRRQIEAFMYSYMSIYRRVHSIETENLLVLHSSNLIIKTSGFITIEKISEDTGYTTRYINKCFRDEIGLSPKQFGKIIRFQSAVSALNDPNGRNITDIATELGYYDQAHFIHDFKQFTGLTPKNYQHKLESSDFKNKLNIIL